MLKDHETGNFFKKRLLTPDKKVNLAPREFIDEADALEKFYKREKNYDGFKLIGQRRRRTHNSWFSNVEPLMRKERENLAYINPKDASKLGIESGDVVVVKSDAGRIKIKARITDDLMRGVVSVPHGWGHDMSSGLKTAKKYPGVNVNKLMASGPGSLEKFAGMAKLTGVRISIKKAKKQKL